MKHETYMQRCLQLAAKALGNTYPNPVVGCVIVHNGEIIGEGYHQKAGEPHAEINAINSVKHPELLKESTVYVSLEPCAHFGKTPPCALKLKEIGVKKVVIGTLDSYEKVDGKGKKILEEAGIKVVTGILEEECRQLNKRFFTFHQKKRPYIILKWAQSADDFMDKDFKPVHISNALASQFVHQLRAQEHAILVGTATALRDNPSLTVRKIKGENPVRILIDSELKVPSDFNIYSDEAETIVINTIKNEASKNIKWKKSEEISVENILKILYENQIQSVIIEGGRFTLEQFIKTGWWDEAIIIKNKDLKLQNGTNAPILDGEPVEKLDFNNNSVELYLNNGLENILNFA